MPQLLGGPLVTYTHFDGIMTMMVPGLPPVCPAAPAAPALPRASGTCRSPTSCLCGARTCAWPPQTSSTSAACPGASPSAACATTCESLPPRPRARALGGALGAWCPHVRLYTCVCREALGIWCPHVRYTCVCREGGVGRGVWGRGCCSLVRVTRHAQAVSTLPPRGPPSSAGGVVAQACRGAGLHPGAG